MTILLSICVVKNCQHPHRLLVLSQVEDLASLRAPSQNFSTLPGRSRQCCCGPPQPCGEDGYAEHPSAVIRSGAGRAPGQSPANTRVKLLIRPLDDSCHSAGGNVSFFTQQSPTGLHPDLTASSGQTYSYEGAVRY